MKNCFSPKEQYLSIIAAESSEYIQCNFLMGLNILTDENLTVNIDGQHLRPPVLAILLETIERENFDGLLA